MKIAVLSSFPPRKCGIAYLTQNLFSELKNQGHELKLFGLDPSQNEIQLNTSSLFGLLEIIPLLEKEKIDRISIQFIISFFNKKFFGLNFLLLLWALRKKRVVVTLHEIHYIRTFKQIFQNPLDLFHIVLEGLIARMSSGIIVHTHTQAAIMEKYGAKNICPIYLGIRTQQISRERKALHRALFFGKLAPIKGVHLFAEIAKACPHIQFTIATSIETKFESYRKEVEKLLLGLPNLEFICKEWIGDEEKDGYFKDADILVLPYVSGFYQSGAASESGVYNIPIIVTDLGPLTEIPDKFHNGIIVKTFEAQDFRIAIDTIFSNYSYYLQGVQAYREQANWTMAARNYSQFLLKP